MGWTVGVPHCLGHSNILLLQQWLTWSPEVAADLCLAPFQVWKQRARRRYIVKSGKLILVSEGPPHPQPGSGGGHFLQFHPWDLGCGPGKEGAEAAKESADRIGRELLTVSAHHPEKVAMCTIYVVDEHVLRAGCTPDKRNLTRSHPAKGQAGWSVSWSHSVLMRCPTAFRAPLTQTEEAQSYLRLLRGLACSSHRPRCSGLLKALGRVRALLGRYSVATSFL